MTPQQQAAAVRDAAGLFRDEACGVLEVRGADRVRWLDGMLSNDVAALEPGADRSGCAALLLTRQGRIVADPHVLAFEDCLWLLVERAAVGAVRETLERFIVADDVVLEDTSAAHSCLALEGPAAAEVLDAALGAPLVLGEGAGVACELAGTPVRGAAVGLLPGARRVLVPSGAADAVAAALRASGASFGLVSGAPEALEILRIEAGRPRLGVDLDESVLPAEAGLEAAISFTKGCYTGQEVVARMASRGGPAHRLVGLRLEGPPPPPGAGIHDGERRVGELTSGCESALAGAIGLGFVRSASAEPGRELTVDAQPARVVPLPFVA